ncbi:MAG: cupin domain-containing protein [Acidobacteriota bacterium]
MKKLLIFLPAAILFAAAPAGFNDWTAEALKERGEALKKTMKAGLASETVANWGNHQMLVIHREATGQAEYHEKQIDFIIVRGGQGSIRIGGKIVDGKTSAPNEIRGTSIEGAELHPLKEGDVMHIPAKTPHQVMLETGQTIDYLAIKVDVQ